MKTKSIGFVLTVLITLSATRLSAQTSVRADFTDQGFVKLDVNGTVRAKIVEITGAELAEQFPSSEAVERGMVVAIDRRNPEMHCLSRGACNRCDAGIVSGANNFPIGAVKGSAADARAAPYVAQSGGACACADIVPGGGLYELQVADFFADLLSGSTFPQVRCEPSRERLGLHFSKPRH